MFWNSYFRYVLPVFVICLFGFSHGDVSALQDSDIPMDSAMITVSSYIVVNVSKQTVECHTCDLKPVSSDVVGILKFLVDTRWPTRLQIENATRDNFNCSETYLTQHFKEGGNYTIDVTYQEKQGLVCALRLQNDPGSSFVPLYVAMGIFTAVAVLWIIISKYCSWNKYRFFQKFGSSNEEEPLLAKIAAKPDVHSGLISSTGITGQPDVKRNVQIATSGENKPKKERLKSLDTFRGISMVIMIFVNYGGGGYWFFNHSTWNGLTVADLVFPWFVFIMGTSMAYSFTSLLRNNTPKHQMLLKIVRRTCILFFLGLVINTSGCSSVDVKNIRIPGVLQRFAGTYFITATVHMFFSKPVNSNSLSNGSKFSDIVNYWPEWIINIFFIVLHLFLTFLIDVPGCGRGYLGPGGLADHGQYFQCTGGAAAFIDIKFFGKRHIYAHPTSDEVYQSGMPHDPEGILGTLTSSVMCFLGLQAGKILMLYKDRFGRVMRFIVWGTTLSLLAGILCKFSKNDGWIPVNKNFWSVSFVFCLAGFGFFLLCFCYLMIDEWKIWNGAPFYYPGMNAILIYMGHELFHNTFPVSWNVPNTHASRLPLDLYGAAFWVTVATYLYYIGSFYVI